MKKRLKREIPFHLMLLLPMLFLAVFSFAPLFGILMAFQDYFPAKGILQSRWVGLENFDFIFSLPSSRQIFANTIIISLGKLAAGIIVPVFFALLLNEIRVIAFKRTVQTIVYLPHFLSWVVLANVVSSILGFDGPVNSLIQSMGHDPILFLGSNVWFRPVIILSDCWKEFGYGSIIYLSALTSIDPGLYESASLDGASRLQKIFYITLPMLVPTIVLMMALNLGNILNAGFDQIFNLYNPLVYETGDIIDTYVYRIGLLSMQYSLATAAGLIKSVIGFVLIMSSNLVSRKLVSRSIF